MNYWIRNKQRFIEVLDKLHIKEFIQAEKLHTVDDLFIQIESSPMNKDILDRISYYLIYDRLMNSIKTGCEVKLNSPIDFVFETKNVKLINRRLSRLNSDWKLPLTLLASKSFFMSIVAFLIWCSMVFIFIKTYPEFFIVTFDILSISFLLFILIIPELLLRFLLPQIFGVEEFVGIKNFSDLIDELCRLNRNNYLSNNYKMMREDIFDLYGPF